MVDLLWYWLIEVFLQAMTGYLITLGSCHDRKRGTLELRRTLFVDLAINILSQILVAINILEKIIVCCQ